MKQQLTDTAIAMMSTATAGEIINPDAEAIIKVSSPIITGLLLPLVKDFIIYLHGELKKKIYKQKQKNKKNVQSTADSKGLSKGNE
jgi:hypothetical protein